MNQSNKNAFVFNKFLAWAEGAGYDGAYTCNSDTGVFIPLNPMTADLWETWKAASGGEAMTPHAQYLFETQELRQKRGTFGSAYATPRGKDRIRLMDLNLRTIKAGDLGYLDPVSREEFAVLDKKTLEKGWFEWLDGMTVNQIAERIEAHFGYRAHRVGAAFWIV